VDTPSLDITSGDGLGILCLCRVDALPVGVTTKGVVTKNRHSSGAPTSAPYVLQIENTGTEVVWNFSVCNAASVNTTVRTPPASPITAGSYHVVCCSWTPGKELRIVSNGTVRGVNTTSIPTALGDSDRGVVIGQRSTGETRFADVTIFGLVIVNYPFSFGEMTSWFAVEPWKWMAPDSLHSISAITNVGGMLSRVVQSLGEGIDSLVPVVVPGTDTQLLGMELVDDLGVPVLAPTAGVWYNLDVGWSLKPGRPPQNVITSLSGEGVTFDTLYPAGEENPAHPVHVVDTGGRASVDLGWSPDGDAAYLSVFDAAVAFWRVSFPAAGTYTFVLEGIGQRTVEVGAGVLATVPTIVVIKMNPLNRESSLLAQISFTGVYPSGGLDLPDGTLGRPRYFFGDINAAPPYQFSYTLDDPFKLHVYTISGEVAVGAPLTFTTTALFIGP